MFICIGIPKHWRLSLFRYETFIDFLSLVFRHDEWEIQFLLCWPFHLTQQTFGASRRPQTGLAASSFKSQLTSPSFGSQLTAFFQNHQESQSIASGHDVIRTPVYFLSGVFIMTSVSVTSSVRQREHLCSMCVPAHAPSRIVLSLTKPNDKI